MISKLILYSSCIIAVLADMLFVYYAKKSSHPINIIIFAFILTIISGSIWTYSMIKGIESSLAITTYAILTTIGCTILGSFIFKENISIINIIGMILAIISLIFINIK